MNRSKPTFSHPSLWGASWKLAVKAGNPPAFDIEGVRELLNRHFGTSPDNQDDPLNLLQNDAVLELGVKEDKDAQRITDDFLRQNLICEKTPLSSEPHERFPSFLAPSAAHISPPLILRVTGKVDTSHISKAAYLASRLSVFMPEKDARSGFESCQQGSTFELPLSYQEQADSLAQRLIDLGYTVEIQRASRGLWDT